MADVGSQCLKFLLNKLYFNNLFNILLFNAKPRLLFSLWYTIIYSVPQALQVENSEGHAY